MSPTFDIGDAPTLTWLLYSDAAKTTLADATVALTVMKPDGTSLTPSVTHVGTGSYSSTITPTIPGRWRYRWAATGALVAAEEGMFVVREREVPAS